MAQTLEFVRVQRTSLAFYHGAFYVIHYFSPAVRYNHLSVLCELMHVALPSLAACLQTLSHGQFSAEAQSKVAESLDISSVEVEAMGR